MIPIDFTGKVALVTGVGDNESFAWFISKALQAAGAQIVLACHNYADGLTVASSIRCPVLVVLGQRDQMAPEKNTTALIAALADKRVIAIPDCGHSLMTEAPDAVLDALREFL